MKAMVFHEIGDFRLEEVEKPVPTGNQILIKVGACGICGSDIPRVYELGTRVAPVILGHEFSGVVEEVANKDDEYLLGKKVAVFPLIPCGECDMCHKGDFAKCSNYQYLGSRNNGGFAEYCLIPSKWHLVVPEDQSIKLEDLAVTEPATVAQHAIRRANLHAGDSILITGAGPIGILAARWARIMGANKIFISDIDDEKVNFANNDGFIGINAIKNDVYEFINESTDLRGVDVALEGTGSSDGLNTAIKCVRADGTIALMGNPHKDTVLKLDNHSLILRKELNLRGVWNSYYNEIPINEWDYTVKMIEEDKLEVNDLITNKVSLENLKDLFDKIHEGKISVKKALYFNSGE